MSDCPPGCRVNFNILKVIYQLEAVTYVFVQTAKRNLFIKNGNKGTDYSATYESVAVPVDRDKEIRTALSTH